MTIIWLKNDVSQAAVLTASGALPTIKTFFNLGFINFFICYRPIVDFVDDTVMNLTLKRPGLSFFLGAGCAVSDVLG
jgi:hypothetical protein